jgi:hypothetical protein
MKNITREVKSLNPADRAALERVIGASLDENSLVTINVAGVTGAADDPASSGSDPATTGSSAWWSTIYEGLSDDEIDRLDQAIRQRANLTRTFS